MSTLTASGSTSARGCTAPGYWRMPTSRADRVRAQHAAPAAAAADPRRPVGKAGFSRITCAPWFPIPAGQASRRPIGGQGGWPRGWMIRAPISAISGLSRQEPNHSANPRSGAWPFLATGLPGRRPGRADVDKR